MKTEFLKELGLTDEQIKSVMAENGKDVNKIKEDLEGITNQLTAAQITIKERDKQIEGLKKVDGEALQAEITKLQTANKEAEKKYKDELKDIKLTNAIKLAIAGKVYDEDMTASLFDRAKLVLTDEGTVAGLEEQLTTIKKDKAFLFKTEKVDTDYKPAGGGTPNNNNPFAKETFNLTEQGKLFKENPTRARELAIAAGITF